MKKSVLLSALGYFPDFGGVENSLKFLTKEFVVLGYQPIVLAGQSKFCDYKRVSRTNGVIVLRFRLRPFKNEIANLIFSPFAILDLLLLFSIIKKRKRICLSVNRNQLTGFLATFFFKNSVYLAPGFSKFQAKPEMLSADMSFLQSYLSSFKLLFHHWFDKGVLKRSSKIFLFSENMRAQALEVDKDLEKRDADMTITKPGVDLDVFSPVTNLEKKEIRKSLGLPLDSTLALSVGRFVSAKGFKYLISAVKYLPNDVSLVIVGDGPEKMSLMLDSQELIKQGRVIFVGKSTQVSQYYAASDVFVLSSVYEPLGQTLLEAAATGLPIVSFLPTTENRIVNATYEIFGDSAFYAESRSDEGLAKAIISYLELDIQEKTKVSNKVREAVVSKCSWKKLANQLIESGEL